MLLRMAWGCRLTNSCPSEDGGNLKLGNNQRAYLPTDRAAAPARFQLARPFKILFPGALPSRR